MSVRFAAIALIAVPALAGSPSYRVWSGGIAVPNEDARLAEPLTQGLNRAFARQPRVKIVSPKELAAWKAEQERNKPAPAPDDLPELAQARTLLHQGKSHYQAIQYEEALTKLLRARRQFILSLNLLRSNRDLIDAHLYLGMTFAALEQKDKAKEEFKRVVYLDPKREIASKEFPPTALAIFAKARQEVLSNEMGRLSLRSKPSGAQVYLNGKLSGETPLDMSLYSGDYFVLVEKPGIRPWYRMVSVDASGAPIDADLEPSAALDPELFRVREGNDQGSEDLATLYEYANGLKADVLVLATLQKMADYRLLGQLVDVKSGKFSKVAVATVGPTLGTFDQAALDTAEALMGMIDAEGNLLTDLKMPEPSTENLGVAGPREEAPVIRPQKPWYKKWWIYPVIVGVGAGAYLGFTRIGGSSGATIIFDNSGNQ